MELYDSTDTGEYKERFMLGVVKVLEVLPMRKISFYGFGRGRFLHESVSAPNHEPTNVGDRSLAHLSTLTARGGVYRIKLLHKCLVLFCVEAFCQVVCCFDG